MTFSLNLYVDFHFPLSLIQLINELLRNKNFDPKNPNQPIDNTTREWYSQPRPPGDETSEVLTINYKIPLSISEFQAEILRESCHVEVWYKDRSNNWNNSIWTFIDSRCTLLSWISRDLGGRGFEEQG